MVDSLGVRLVTDTDDLVTLSWSWSLNSVVKTGVRIEINELYLTWKLSSSSCKMRREDCAVAAVEDLD
jgi:hypothetical protein